MVGWSDLESGPVVEVGMRALGPALGPALGLALGPALGLALDSGVENPPSR